MNKIYLYIILALLGLCLGSFAGATVWRLRARQLKRDLAEGEHVSKKEFEKLKKLTEKSVINDHSKCLNCDYQLRWYDLIPVISWLSLGGKCRKCKKNIGSMEIFIELLTMVFFLSSFYFWPFQLISGVEVARLVLWLVAGVCFAIMFAYDKKWFLIPNSVNFATIGIGFVCSLIVVIFSYDPVLSLLEILGSVFVLSGIYLILYLASKGKWIGFGDIKLGLGLALLLADWKLAVIALFLANLIGCVIVIPSMISGKLNRNSRVPFGPLLILGTVFALLFGNNILSLYFSLL